MPTRILGFAFANKEMAELLTVGGIKLNVSPLEYQRIDQTQSRFQKQNC